MKLVETTGSINADGNIVLQPGALTKLDAKIGESVCLTYLASQNTKTKNASYSLLLTKDGIESLAKPLESAGDAELVIPHVLMETAGIPVGGKINIECTPGVIMISNTDSIDMVPPCLMELFEELGIEPDTIRAVIQEGGL